MLLVDALIGSGALASSWLWWRASRQRLRRISRLEELDAGGVNRIVTALNRTQILNLRAALAASATAALAVLGMSLQPGFILDIPRYPIRREFQTAA
jgi:hypothetical protein